MATDLNYVSCIIFLVDLMKYLAPVSRRIFERIQSTRPNALAS